MWSEKDAEDSEEPDWVKLERRHFADYRDLNNDGFMDRDEVQQWISPPAFDHIKAEAEHLIFQSDADKVQVVSTVQFQVIYLLNVFCENCEISCTL